MDFEEKKAVAYNHYADLKEKKASLEDIRAIADLMLDYAYRSKIYGFEHSPEKESSVDFVFLCGYELDTPILDDRIKLALKVFKDRKARNIVISGASPVGKHSYPYSLSIVEKQIDGKRIILEKKGTNTYHSFAEFWKEYPHFKRGIIVSSYEHLPRIILYLSKINQNTELEFVGKPVPIAERKKFVAHEYARIMEFVKGELSSERPIA